MNSPMKKVVYVERKFQGFFSLEKVFRQIAKYLSPGEFESSFQQVKFPAGFKGIVKNLLSFKPQGADIYHVTGDITYIALVLPPAKTVLTIPDVSILRYRTGVRRYVLKKILFDLPVRRARYITAISEKTKDDIINEIGCDPKKIRAIGLPVDEMFSVPDKPAFNSECPNILQVGALRYKNLPGVIRAIEGLKCKLTIIGRLDDATTELLKEKRISFENVSMLDDAGVKENYRKADLVVFCSLYEGFGLPIIEAQAMETPVITSNLDPMKDVAGEGALLVDPHNIGEIRSAIDSVIGDSSLRKQLVEKGSNNVKRFRPEAIAARYAELYSEVIAAQNDN